MLFKQFLLGLFLMFFSCGFTTIQKANAERLWWSHNFCAKMESIVSTNKNFSIVAKDETPFSPPELDPLFSQFINCEVKMPKMVPNTHYLLFCPNTGDPFRPEFSAGFQVDEAGQLYIEVVEYPDPLPISSINVYVAAIPGFSSDWYLYCDLNKKFFHTTFAYQPICSKTASGKELMISKKDCSGTIVDIVFRGFAPHEKVQWKSVCDKKVFTSSQIMDEKGEFSFTLCPQVEKKTKGVDTISIRSGEDTLQASCDWDISPLDIQCLKPPFCFRRTRPDESLALQP